MDKLADYKSMIDFLTEAYAHLQSLRADDIKEGKNINVFSLWNSFSGITEPIHSKILQFLLSPHNMHGQGNLFINLLLKRINVDFKENEVKAAIEKAGLEVVEINHQGEWVNITARKN